MITMNNKAWTIFCFGSWVEPAKKKLTPQETKVYNMVNAGFPRFAIENRLSISESRVRGLMIQLEQKGWL